MKLLYIFRMLFDCAKKSKKIVLVSVRLIVYKKPRSEFQNEVNSLSEFVHFLNVSCFLRQDQIFSWMILSLIYQFVADC